MPQYMHLSTQLLWFDQEELSIILCCYLMGLVFGGWAWSLLIIGPIVYIPIKRRQPRGFLLHLLYRVGLAQLKGYPGPEAKVFFE
ncbi:MAG: type IV conjugative transfer system protein TraL [Gammaproteobacteria bacterium]